MRWGADSFRLLLFFGHFNFCWRRRQHWPVFDCDSGDGGSILFILISWFSLHSRHIQCGGQRRRRSHPIGCATVAKWKSRIQLFIQSAPGAAARGNTIFFNLFFSWFPGLHTPYGVRVTTFNSHFFKQFIKSILKSSKMKTPRIARHRSIRYCVGRKRYAEHWPIYHA